MPKSAKSFRRATDEERKQAAALFSSGKSIVQVAAEMGRDTSSVKEWLRDDPNTKIAVKRDMSATALGEIGRNLQQLIAIRDDPDTSVKEKLEAIKQIDVRAGLQIVDETKSRSIINILGENINIVEMGSSVDGLIRKIARRLGPEAEKIVDAEFTVGPAGLEDRAGGPGDADGDDGGAHPPPSPAQEA